MSMHPAPDCWTGEGGFILVDVAGFPPPGNLLPGVPFRLCQSAAFAFGIALAHQPGADTPHVHNPIYADAIYVAIPVSS